MAFPWVVSLPSEKTSVQKNSVLLEVRPGPVTMQKSRRGRDAFRPRQRSPRSNALQVCHCGVLPVRLCPVQKKKKSLIKKSTLTKEKRSNNVMAILICGENMTSCEFVCLQEETCGCWLTTGDLMHTPYLSAGFLPTGTTECCTSHF